MNSIKYVFSRSFLFLLYILFEKVLQVNAKQCQYYPLDGTGSVQIFRCSVFERCCGNTCCKAFHNLSFYQIWYFWIVMALLFLMCCGGGFWARHRRYEGVRTLPTVTTTTVPNTQQSSRSRSHPPGTTVFYPIGGYGQYPAYGTVVLSGVENPPPFSAVQTSMPAEMLPPYTGPPPSYETIYKTAPQTHSQLPQ